MKDSATFLFFAAIFWPWGLLFIDILGWFFTGHAFTAVPWDFLRVWGAIAYPFIIGSFVASVYA